MGGESCTVLRLRLMRKLAMSHIPSFHCHFLTLTPPAPFRKLCQMSGSLCSVWGSQSAGTICTDTVGQWAFTKPPLLQECMLTGGGYPNLVDLVEWKFFVKGKLGASKTFH